MIAGPCKVIADPCKVIAGPCKVIASPCKETAGPCNVIEGWVVIVKIAKIFTPAMMTYLTGGICGAMLSLLEFDSIAVKYLVAF